MQLEDDIKPRLIELLYDPLYKGNSTFAKEMFLQLLLSTCFLLAGLSVTHFRAPVHTSFLIEALLPNKLNCCCLSNSAMVYASVYPWGLTMSFRISYYQTLTSCYA